MFVCLFAFTIVRSTRPSLKRINADFFPDKDIEADRIERENRLMLNSNLAGQKTSSEIRATLRHKQKVDTEC